MDSLNIYRKLEDDDFRILILFIKLKMVLIKRNSIRLEVDDIYESYDIKIEYKFLSGSIEKTISAGGFLGSLRGIHLI